MGKVTGGLTDGQQTVKLNKPKYSFGNPPGCSDVDVEDEEEDEEAESGQLSPSGWQMTS